MRSLFIASSAYVEHVLKTNVTLTLRLVSKPERVKNKIFDVLGYSHHDNALLMITIPMKL